MTDAFDEDLDLLRSAAREAGKIALGYFRQNPHSWMKAGDSPVSDADIAVDRFLGEMLGGARPDHGWLSEETKDDPARLACKRVFVVDPIDGTRGFLAGRQEWTVSLALVEDGRPIAAALVAPALDEVFYAAAGRGAFLNGARLRIAGAETLSAARLVGPRRYLRGVAGAAGQPVEQVRFVGSLAYRIALVAAGQADIAVGREGAHDWDLAAADLLVAEAGGVVTDVSGTRLRYNREETRHPPVVAANSGLAAEARRLVMQTLDDPAPA